MAIFATAGAKLYIGTAMSLSSADLTAASFEGQSWTEINPLENIGALGDEASEITFESVGNPRVQKLKGARNAGTMAVVAGIDYSDAGQIALLAAEKTPHDYAFRLVFPDAPAEKSATATITIADPGVITWEDHGLVAGTPVKLTTTGALPTGLTAGTTYYVVGSITDDTFSLAATPGGEAIETTSTQSGVHTATTVPAGSERLFAAKVMSASEQLDGANNVMKLNSNLGVNSNIVRVAALG